MSKSVRGVAGIIYRAVIGLHLIPPRHFREKGEIVLTDVIHIY